MMLSVSLLFSSATPAFAFSQSNMEPQSYDTADDQISLATEYFEEDLPPVLEENISFNDPLSIITAKSDPPPTFTLKSYEDIAFSEATAILDKYQYFSAITDQEDIDTLCEGFNVNSSALIELETAGIQLEESILYAQMEYRYGFSIAELLHKRPDIDSCKELNKEMMVYIHSVARFLESNELDQELRQYILAGATFSQLKNAYAINICLGIGMPALLTKETVISQNSTKKI